MPRFHGDEGEAAMMQRMEAGLVTVVICVYNAGDYLLSAVTSILHQTYPHLEILIVDDGSTDGCMTSIAHLSDPRIRILTQPNRGKPAALNLALQSMRGEFYAVQDADDLSHPRRVELQVQCMRERPHLAAVFCGHELILRERRVAPRFCEKDEAACRREIDRMSMPAHDPTAMYRCSMVRDLRYDEDLPIVEGFDYIMRVGETMPMRVLGECLYSYRIHLATVTKRNPELRDRMLATALRKVHERRGMSSRTPSAVGRGRAGSRLRHRTDDNDLVSHFMVSIVDQRHAGRWRDAVHAAARCIALHPLDPYYYKPALYAVAPVGVIDWHRARNPK
jgi:glycosyltransferase involved in cell wall biosynthesis